MDRLVCSLETIHRALRAAPERSRGDPRVIEALAACLRDLHAIAAQAVENDGRARRLRLIDCAAPLAAPEISGR